MLYQNGVNKSFYIAMDQVVNHGIVACNCWDETTTLYLYDKSHHIYLLKKSIKAHNNEVVIDRIVWSPSIIEYLSDWTTYVSATNNRDTFGKAVLDLLSGICHYITHETWNVDKRLTYRDNQLIVTENSKEYPYFPTISDILLLNWTRF